MARGAVIERLKAAVADVLDAQMLRPLLILALFAAPRLRRRQAGETLFGAQPLPAALTAGPIGFYSRGCMAGGIQLPPDGPIGRRSAVAKSAMGIARPRRLCRNARA